MHFSVTGRHANTREIKDFINNVRLKLQQFFQDQTCRHSVAEN